MSRPGHPIGQTRAVTPGLLVGELTDDERRRFDLVHERDRIERVGDSGDDVGVAVDLGDQVGRLAMQRLVATTGLIARSDSLIGPSLTGGHRRRERVPVTLLRPVQRESAVEDPARVLRRLGRVDHRQRRDRLERRRIGRRGEQLTDAAVGNSQHPDLVAQHPWLMRDRLDDVVAVQRLQPLEVGVRAARAAGAAHVDVDHRVPEQRQVRAKAGLRWAVWGRVAVARVLDQRRPRAGAARRMYVDRELRAVTGREVLVVGGIGRGQLPLAGLGA